MDIKEIKLEKRRLEIEVEKAVVRYEGVTGTHLMAIALDRVYSIGEEYGTIARVKIDCGI